MALNYPNRQFKAIAVTISQRQAQFLKETGFKPSRLLQQAIDELMNATNPGDLKDILGIQRQKIKILTETMLKQKDFIEKNGLLNKYLQ